MLIKNLYPQLGLVNGIIGDVFKTFVANCNKTLQAYTIHKPTHVNKFQQFHIRLPITTKHNIWWTSLKCCGNSTKFQKVMLYTSNSWT